MNCQYCDEPGAVKCHCGHYACESHTYFTREKNVLTSVCLACYEEAKQATEEIELT